MSVALIVGIALAILVLLFILAQVVIGWFLDSLHEELLFEHKEKEKKQNSIERSYALEQGLRKQLKELEAERQKAEQEKRELDPQVKWNLSRCLAGIENAPHSRDKYQEEIAESEAMAKELEDKIRKWEKFYILSGQFLQ